MSDGLQHACARFWSGCVAERAAGPAGCESDFLLLHMLPESVASA